MNCSCIIPLLLLCGQNRGGRSGQNGCGCEEPTRPKPPRARQEQDSCPREDSRFEPRFEQRPFSGNGSTCGCEGESN